MDKVEAGIAEEEQKLSPVAVFLCALRRLGGEILFSAGTWELSPPEV
jgi:hypothetical protein